MTLRTDAIWAMTMNSIWIFMQSKPSEWKNTEDKSYSIPYHWMTRQLKMGVKTPLSSTDPVKEQRDMCSLDRENQYLCLVVLTKVAQ